MKKAYLEKLSLFFLIIWGHVFLASCTENKSQQGDNDNDEFSQQSSEADLSRYELLALFDTKLDSVKLEAIAESFTQGILVHQIFPNKIHRYEDENCFIFFSQDIYITSDYRLKAQFINQTRSQGIYELAIFPLRGDDVISVFFIRNFLDEKEDVAVVLTKNEDRYFTHIFSESCGNGGCGIYPFHELVAPIEELENVGSYEAFMEAYGRMEK
jgi:hypothetical protein